MTSDRLVVGGSWREGQWPRVGEEGLPAQLFVASCTPTDDLAACETDTNPFWAALAAVAGAPCGPRGNIARDPSHHPRIRRANGVVYCIRIFVREWHTGARPCTS